MEVLVSKLLDLEAIHVHDPYENEDAFDDLGTNTAQQLTELEKTIRERLQTQKKLGPSNVIDTNNIPERCYMWWDIGSRIANGSGAIVFDTSPTKIIRIVQLNDEDKRAKFRNGVILHHKLQNVEGELECVPKLHDVFICKSTKYKSVILGIMVLDKCQGTILDIMSRLNKTVDDIVPFVRGVSISLRNNVQMIHKNNIFHRDLVVSNILCDKIPNTDEKYKVSFIDFEYGGGTVTDSTERVISAYTATDKQQIEYICSALLVLAKLILQEQTAPEESIADIAKICKRANISSTDIQQFIQKKT